MNSVFASLVWKEWHEHKWKLASLTAIAVLAPLGLWGRVSLDDMMGVLLLNLILFLPLAAAFMGMGAAASERSQGTLLFLQSLPRSPRLLGGIKLAFCIATVVLPVWISIALAAGASMIADTLGWQRVRIGDYPWKLGLGHWELDLMAMTALGAISLVTWIAALGVNRESEVRAGAVSLAIVLGVWASFAAIWLFLYSLYADSNAVQSFSSYCLFGGLETLMVALPAGIAIPQPLFLRPPTPWPVLVVSFIVVHGSLAWRYIVRFGQLENNDRLSAHAAMAYGRSTAWLGPPRSSPLNAILWKQFRESTPIVVAGVVCALGLVMVMVLVELYGHGVVDDSAFYGELGAITTWMFAFFGFLAGLIAGVGLSATDFEPRHFTFWRSRPIQIDQWFWTKFCVGLGLLIGAFGMPMLLGIALNRAYEPTSNTEVYATLMLLSSIIPYCAAVLAGCVLRHTIYAALLGSGLAMGIWVYVGTQEITPNTQFLVMVGVSVVFTLAAWIAVRNDWSFRT